MVGGEGEGEVVVDLGVLREPDRGELEVVERLRNLVEHEPGATALVTGLGVVGVLLDQGVEPGEAWSG